MLSEILNRYYRLTQEALSSGHKEHMKITISTDKAKLDFYLIYTFLHNDSYWAKGIPFEVVQRSIKNSMCFGVYIDEQQIGFARVITDHATFAYLADVFIVEEFRGKGISKQLIAHIKGHPDLQGLRRWMLATADAHGLYEQFDFKSLSLPDRFMEISKKNFYLN